MLELRPSCECCDRDLPPDSLDAAAALARHPASTARVFAPEGCR